jgi:hypothetical protein
MKNKLLIEKKTYYAHCISKKGKNYDSLLKINKKLCEKIPNEIWLTLGRGLKILKYEDQLIKYMYSYSNQHNKKLKSAFKGLPDNFANNENIIIIDWGCGQGIGTLTYIDFLKNKLSKKEIKAHLKNIHLIEPSKIAIKRASLHIYNTSKYLKKRIITINKKLDDLMNSDFNVEDSKVFLHIFSNVLDMDSFQNKNILKLILNNFNGTNFFVIASPHIGREAKKKIDSFVNLFSNNDNFHVYKQKNNKKGNWRKTTWSRIIRIFKADIKN